LAKGFSVRTGRDAEGPTNGRLRPEDETVVVLMGLDSIDDVLAGLTGEGRSPDTPAIAVSGASRDEEQVVAGTLATLAEKVRAVGLESPVTLIVGEAGRRALERTAEATGKAPVVVGVA
jgi:siroheme synthase